MVDQVAQFIADFDPWWMVAIAISLILLDWALLQTEALLALGLGTLLLAIINALNFPPLVQLWSYPVAILASFFLQRQLFVLITTAKSPYQSLETMGTKALETHVGKIGTLKVLSNKDESGDHFFAYKDKTNLDSKAKETRTSTTVQSVTKLELPDGSIHPSKYVGESEVHNGLEVKVMGVSNGALLVERIIAK